jgi:hypothetical protein
MIEPRERDRRICQRRSSDLFEIHMEEFERNFEGAGCPPSAFDLHFVFLPVIEGEGGGLLVLSKRPVQGSRGVDSARKQDDVLFHFYRSCRDDKRRGFFLQGALLVPVFMPYYWTKI